MTPEPIADRFVAPLGARIAADLNARVRALGLCRHYVFVGDALQEAALRWLDAADLDETARAAWVRWCTALDNAVAEFALAPGRLDAALILLDSPCALLLGELDDLSRREALLRGIVELHDDGAAVRPDEDRVLDLLPTPPDGTGGGRSAVTTALQQRRRRKLPEEPSDRP